MFNPDASGERGETEPFDALILGAGISGLVSASVLARQGLSRIVVIDEYDRLGGNHIDAHLGPYTFDAGSLIFQDDSPLLRHFPELLPLYQPISPSWGRLNPQGRVTQYPLSIRDDLVRAGPVEWTRIAASVAVGRLFRRRLRNAYDYAQHWIGRRFLHRSGLHAYIGRFYGRPAEAIDLRFAEQRMYWIRQRSELRDYLRRWLRPEPHEVAPSQSLARPRDGFAQLYRAAAERLESRGVSFRLNADLRRLRRLEGGGFVLEIGQRSFAATRVISTIPLERACSLCGLEAGAALPTVTLISLFFSFAGERGFPQAILYNFSEAGAWKRLTVYSDFYGRAEGREYFTVEVNADHVDGSVERAAADFRAHATANGLFAGDLRLEGDHVLANAYPVYAEGGEAQAAEAIAALSAFGVEAVGRQGRFDYHPTARVSTQKAEASLGFAW